MQQPQVIDQVKVCAPRPEVCETLVMNTIPGVHEYDYTSNGKTTTLFRDIKSALVYQEGEGPFACALKEGAMVIEQGDGCAVMEFNHGTFNISYFADGVLQSQLTHVVPRGGLTALATMIKNDAMFPGSIREVGDDLIVNAIANAKPNQPLTYRGLSFQEAFERSVVRWIRSAYAAGKTHWQQFTARDWVGANNKILCSGGAAPLSRYWVEWIREQAQTRKASGDSQEIANAIKMEMMADNIVICPNSRFANALGMLELDPVGGFTVSVDFGYSAVKHATSADRVGLTTSAIALPYSKINLRDIRTGSAYIELKSGPLYDKLKKAGQPTSYVFGAAANSIIGAEKIINNAKEQYIPHAVLAVCSPDLIQEPAKSKRTTGVVAS